jgi:hypothetical protein
MAGNAARVQDLHELARIWTRRKLRVLEHPGWETWGRSSTITFDALGCHHIGSAHDLDRLLHDGRPGIPGPLCNVALHARSALPGFLGEVVLMASGRANHFGVATWNSSQALGVEATGPPFTNYLAYVQLAAGFCEWKDAPPTRILSATPPIPVYLLAAHKEVAQPYGRKPNPSGPGWHEGGRTIQGVRLIDQFRADVAATLDQGDVPEMTQDEFLTALNSLRGQTALKAATAGIGEDVAANLGPLLAKYGAAGMVFVRRPGDNRVYVAHPARELFHVTDPAMFSALSGGEDITTLAMELPDTAPVWAWPRNETP